MDINPGFKQAALYGAVTNELTIRVFEPDGTVKTVITNKHIVSESMKLTGAICDEPELLFGGCVASTFEIDISSKYDIHDRYITVYCAQTATMPLYPGTQIFPGAELYPGRISYTVSFPLFSGDVFSCKLAKNRLTRRLVAYDRFYSRGMRSCKGLYDGLFAGGSAVTLGQLRAAIIQAHFTEAQSVTLPADSFVIHKMETDELTVNDALRMIGEMSGVFLRLNGHGDVEYVDIGTAGEVEEYTFYIDAEAEDYTVTGFDGVETKTLGSYWFDTEPPDPVTYALDNALVTAGYVSSATATGEQFEPAWNGVRSSIAPNFAVEYIPFSLKAQARLWVQPGDRVRFSIKWYSLEEQDGAEVTVEHTKTVESVVLSRRLTGIQAMTDELSAQ